MYVDLQDCRCRTADIILVLTMSVYTRFPETDFARIHEMMDTASERLLLVDAGLTFNSPYPVLLRPQRGVDLYISFDFSGREHDENDLFSVSLWTASSSCAANHLS